MMMMMMMIMMIFIVIITTRSSLVAVVADRTAYDVQYRTVYSQTIKPDSVTSLRMAGTVRFDSTGTVY